MGYTRDVYRPPELEPVAFYKWASDVHHLLENLPEHSESAGGYYRKYPIVICGPHGTGTPLITPDEVFFNGDKGTENENEDGMACESFLVERVFTPMPWEKIENGRYYSWCKTGRKPYDLLVAAALIRLYHHYGEIVIIGGGTRDEWEPARALCEQVFGEAILPPNI